METKYRHSPRRPVFSGAFWLGLGLYLLALSNRWVPGPEDSWPLLLVVIGVALIAGALIKRRPQEISDSQHLPS